MRNPGHAYGLMLGLLLAVTPVQAAGQKVPEQFQLGTILSHCLIRGIDPALAAKISTYYDIYDPATRASIWSMYQAERYGPYCWLLKTKRQTLRGLR